MINQAIDDYIVFLTVEKGASNNTIEAYSNDVRKLANYLGAGRQNKKDKINPRVGFVFEKMLDFLSLLWYVVVLTEKEA